MYCDEKVGIGLVHRSWPIQQMRQDMNETQFCVLTYTNEVHQKSIRMVLVDGAPSAQTSPNQLEQKLEKQQCRKLGFNIYKFGQ